MIHGMRCATIERASFDEIRRLTNDRDRIVAVDMACAAGLVSLLTMQRYRWTRYWYRDVRTLDRILPLCEENARSRPEVDFRLIWVLDAGWSHPVCNQPVFDLHGHLVGIPDLLDPSRGVVGEFAGAGHRDRDQHASDVRRTAQFRAVGLEIVEVVGRDLMDVPDVVRRMEQAADRAALQPKLWQLGREPSRSSPLLGRDAR